MSTLPASAYEALELPAETIKVLTTPQPAPTSTASPNVLQAKPETARDLAPNESAISLYAELLLNIRTVTLFASLRTVHTRETKALLSADGNSITISHEGESATIHLPIKVKGGGDAALFLPARPPSKELSLRLQIEEQEGSDLLGGMQAEERKVNQVPWDGASLNERNAVNASCKSCRALILSSGKIGEWRDLPNENWAEMMDFWHCHKPDEHHLHDHAHEGHVAKKGYAAGNRLRATEGVGFVDLASLLLKEQDCEGVQKLSDQDSGVPALTCQECGSTLGTIDASAEGWRLWKWCISINSNVPNDEAPIRNYSIQKWISARLLFLIENQAVRKFHIHSDTTDESPIPSILIWLFTPDLLFSSSVPSKNRRDPTRAMKVFFEKQMYTPPKPGEVESASIEDVAFPKELYEELELGLTESQKLLPAGARMFKGWQVGLLERFDIEEVARESAREVAN